MYVPFQKCVFGSCLRCQCIKSGTLRQKFADFWPSILSVVISRLSIGGSGHHYRNKKVHRHSFIALCFMWRENYLWPFFNRTFGPWGGPWRCQHEILSSKWGIVGSFRGLGLVTARQDLLSHVGQCQCQRRSHDHSQMESQTCSL